VGLTNKESSSFGFTTTRSIGRFQYERNRQAAYSLVLAIINLHRTHFPVHAAGCAFDLELEECFCINHRFLA
jgi:hypothetical protein